MEKEPSNDNILTADNYTSSVKIEDHAGQLVFEDTVKGSNLPPFTSEIITYPIKWSPERTGKYQISIGVDFAYDIDTSDNSKTTEVAVIIDYNQATDYLVDALPGLIPCDLNGVVAYMPQEPLVPGDTVSNANDVELYTVSLTLEDYKYFAYLDYDPSAKYGHPGALVTIDGLEGRVASAGIHTWPTINGAYYMDDPMVRLTTDDQVYGNRPTVETVDTFSTIRTESKLAPTPGKTCAILVSGKTRRDWERSAFNFDLDLMEGNLTREQLGLQLNSANIERIGNATAGEICTAIEKAKTGYDKIIFYYTGHGNKGWMVTNDPISQQLGYLDLADKLYETNARDICVIIDACYAGSAEGSFRIPLKFQENNVTLIMAAMSTKTSLARVIQETSSGERIWAGFFTWHFAQCYGDPAAESDNQPGISFAEAFNWVRQVNPAISDSTINQRQNPGMMENRATNP